MPDIEQWLDVDFESEASGRGKSMGCIMPSQDEVVFARSYGNEYTGKIYPRSEWPELIAAITAAKGWPYRRIVHPYNQGQEGTCFPPGTLVRMWDGRLKPIEIINRNDRVITAEGSEGVVNKTSVRSVDTTLATLQCKGFEPLRATMEHPVRIQRQGKVRYVGIGKIDDGDLISTEKGWLPWSSLGLVAPYQGNVHNFEVEGDQSYVANGYGVHNCTYNALALAKQITWNRQEGDHQAIPLSPVSGYRWNASGPGTGSTVGGAIRWSESTGLLPTRDYGPNLERVQKGEFKHTHPSRGYYERFQDNWRETSKLFLSHEWEWCKSVDQWVSAMLDGHTGVGGRDGHAICHCGLAWNNGRIASIYCNSWGQWGDSLETAKGPLRSFGYDSESKIQQMVRYDAWILRSERRPSFIGG